MSWVGLRRFGSNLLATVVGWVGFKETVMGWVRRLREMRTTWKTAFHTRDIELINKNLIRTTTVNNISCLLFVAKTSKIVKIM